MPPAAPAHELTCRRCGSAFQPSAVTESVDCPYCGERQAIPTDLRRELDRYEGAVRRELQQADEAHLHAAAWQQWSETEIDPTRNVLMGLGLALGLPLLGSLAVGALIQSGALEPGPWIAVVVMGAAIVGVIAYAAWYVANQKRAAAPVTRLGAVRVACPNCGGMGELTPGDAVDTCNYCRAALVPAETARARGIDAAAMAKREAQLEKYRHERAGHAQIQRYDMTNALPYLVLGSFGPMLLVSALSLSYSMSTGEEPFHPGIFALWGFVIATGGAAVFVFRHRRRRRAALHGALSDLARQFRGSVITTLTESVQWLNRYWAGRYDPANLVASPYFVAAALTARGYPALVDLDAASPGQHRRPRLNVLLAAVVPDDMLGKRGKQLPRGAKAATRIVELGFSFQVIEAGVLATADAKTLDAVRRAPEAAHEVAPLLTAMADYADAIGAGSIAAPS